MVPEAVVKKLEPMIIILTVFHIDAQYKNGDIRLIGGSYPWEGRLEIYLTEEWGTVTDSQWTSEDAQVVCREMGYFKPGESLTLEFDQ